MNMPKYFCSYYVDCTQMSHLLFPFIYSPQGETGEAGNPGPPGESGPGVSIFLCFRVVEHNFLCFYLINMTRM